MSEKKSKFKTWWEKNKKKVCVVGGALVAVGIGAAAYYVLKNKKAAAIVVKKVGVAGLLAAKNLSDVALDFNTAADTCEPVAGETVTADIPIDSVFSDDAIEKTRIVIEDMFIRNLPDGWHRSAEKTAEAAALGIKLADNQTLVDPFEYWRVMT